MSAPTAGNRKQSSVFGKLATIMLVMAFLLMLITTGFFVALVQPTLHGEISPGVAHAWLLVLSLLVMSGVVLTTQAVLQKLLRPLRVLNDGVTRLGEGDLAVTVPRTTTDEFGRLTDTFNLMAGRVREMITARDRLLIDVSHELRSPLTRMKVALELLPDDAHRARLSSEVAEMERMISGLLELERLRTGRGVSLQHQDIVPVLREVVATYEDRAPGVRFSAAGGREVHANVDVEQLTTVMRNLLENALKYSLSDSRAVQVTVEARDDGVRVGVTDDGVGIPPEDAERIFEPFFRVDRSRSKESGGYGLGLSICKRVMEAHGGQIVLEPGNGRGSTFALRFPRALR
ncbi:MAG TPA: HAMP domain-containing sensor histidine kinase [Gemmatimonadaceae bacterium]